MTSTTHQQQPASARIAAFVIEDLPVAGRSGYCTYNRAFIEALVAAGWETHLIVLGPRLPAPLFDPVRVLGMPSVTLHVPAARYLFRRFWVVELRAAARAWFQMLASRWPRRFGTWLASRRRRRQGASGATVIGRICGEVDARRVGELVERIRPTVLLVDTVFRAPSIRSTDRSVPRVLVAHDVFFKRCESLAAAGLAPTPYITRELERELLAGFDAVAAISDTDAADLALLAPTTPVKTLRSPIAAATVTATVPGGATRILYLGSAAHHNVEGLRWFLDAIWPAIVEECPGTILDVVGTIGETLADCPAGVRIHGLLPDIGAIASAATFAVNPVRAGSGLKIKMLDYFAHGLPCVTTSVGAQGFPDSSERPIAIADTAAEFARRVTAWTRNRTEIAQIRAAAHRYVTQFSLSSFEQELTAVLKVVSARGSLRHP